MLKFHTNDVLRAANLWIRWEADQFATFCFCSLAFFDWILFSSYLQSCDSLSVVV